MEGLSVQGLGVDGEIGYRVTDTRVRRQEYRAVSIPPFSPTHGERRGIVIAFSEFQSHRRITAGFSRGESCLLSEGLCDQPGKVVLDFDMAVPIGGMAPCTGLRPSDPLWFEIAHHLPVAHDHPYMLASAEASTLENRSDGCGGHDCATARVPLPKAQSSPFLPASGPRHLEVSAHTTSKGLCTTTEHDLDFPHHSCLSTR